MNFKKSFVLALKSLAVSKMRSLLTMLGIIIGVAAVIIIISLGDGLHNMISEEFDSMGSNMVQVNVAGRGSSREVHPEDMFEIAEENKTVFSAVSPAVMVYGTVKAGTEIYRPSIYGVSEEYDAIRSIAVDEGRFIQYIDVARLQKVCVIGSYMEAEVFGDGNALGEIITIDGQPYTIIGVQETLNADDGPTSYNDNNLYIPYTNATRLNDSDHIGIYVFSAYDDTSSRGKALVESELLRIYGSDDYFAVITMSERMDIMSTINGTIMSVLIGIAAISLLVGGIGIMNIMLVSVTERTREIGIRKSLGAKGKDIRMQFIIEAATTSALGGVIGIIIGVALANVAGSLVGIVAIPSISAIALSFSVSVGVGILFGYLPANKAAALHPIDALRHD